MPWHRIGDPRNAGHSGHIEIVGNQEGRRAIRRTRPVAACGGHESFRRLMEKLRQSCSNGASIPAILEYGIQDENAVSIEEYIDAKRIDTVIGDVRTREGDTAVLALIKDMLQSMLNTLAVLHDTGIIHQDVHPKNVLYDATTKQFTLIDFGASHLREEYDAIPRAQLEINRFFTPADYATAQPETWDLYALGWTAAALCCEYTVLPMLDNAGIIQDKRQILERLNAMSYITPGFKSFLVQATSDEARNRFTSSREMLTALMHCDGRRHRRPLVILALILVIVVGAAALYIMTQGGNQSIPIPPPPADEDTNPVVETDTGTIRGTNTPIELPPPPSSPPPRPAVFEVIEPTDGDTCSWQTRVAGRAEPHDSVWVCVTASGEEQTWSVTGLQANHTGSWDTTVKLGNVSTPASTPFYIVALAHPALPPISGGGSLPAAEFKIKIKVILLK